MTDHKMDSEKSIYLDREEHVHKGELGAKRVVLYSYDSDTDTLEPYSAGASSVYTLRMDDTGTYTYIGEAVPGTDESDSLWRIKRLTNADNTIVWVDGDSSFDNAWDDRASGVYS